MTWRVLLAASLGPLLLASAVHAEGCFLVASAEPQVLPASYGMTALPAGATVRLSFLGVGASLVPDIVTMNNAARHARRIQPVVATPGWRRPHMCP